MRIINLTILLSALILSGCSMSSEYVYKLPFYSSADLTPVWLNEQQAANTVHTIAPFSFKDQHGSAVTNDTYKGKIYAANFFFTSCAGICPVMTTNLLAVQNEFKNDDDVMLLSHTVMPWIDSTAQLRTYAQANGIDDSKWHLVTGSKKELYDLAWNSYFADEDPGYSESTKQFIHTEHVMLIDKKGRVRGVYNGTLKLEIERMIEDIKELKKES